MSRPTVFLDRDGVLVQDPGYVHRVEDLRLLPGVIEGLQLFQRAGFALVVVTNQSGIARGYFSVEDFQAFTQAMRLALEAAAVQLDGVFHCPHLPDAAVPRWAADCECRKPKPGLLLQASQALDLDLKRSLMIGDRVTDLQAGRAAGVRHCYLIGSAEEAAGSADGVFPTLSACAATHLHNQT